MGNLSKAGKGVLAFFVIAIIGTAIALGVVYGTRGSNSPFESARFASVEISFSTPAFLENNETVAKYQKGEIVEQGDIVVLNYTLKDNTSPPSFVDWYIYEDGKPRQIGSNVTTSTFRYTVPDNEFQRNVTFEVRDSLGDSLRLNETFDIEPPVRLEAGIGLEPNTQIVNNNSSELKFNFGKDVSDFTTAEWSFAISTTDDFGDVETVSSSSSFDGTVLNISADFKLANFTEDKTFFWRVSTTNLISSGKDHEIVRTSPHSFVLTPSGSPTEPFKLLSVIANGGSAKIAAGSNITIVVAYDSDWDFTASGKMPSFELNTGAGFAAIVTTNLTPDGPQRLKVDWQVPEEAKQTAIFRVTGTNEGKTLSKDSVTYQIDEGIRWENPFKSVTATQSTWNIADFRALVATVQNGFTFNQNPFYPTYTFAMDSFDFQNIYSGWKIGFSTSASVSPATAQFFDLESKLTTVWNFSFNMDQTKLETDFKLPAGKVYLWLRVSDDGGTTFRNYSNTSAITLAYGNPRQPTLGAFGSFDDTGATQLGEFRQSVDNPVPGAMTLVPKGQGKTSYFSVDSVSATEDKFRVMVMPSTWGNPSEISLLTGDTSENLGGIIYGGTIGESVDPFQAIFNRTSGTTQQWKGTAQFNATQSATVITGNTFIIGNQEYLCFDIPSNTQRGNTFETPFVNGFS